MVLASFARLRSFKSRKSSALREAGDHGRPTFPFQLQLPPFDHNKVSSTQENLAHEQAIALSKLTKLVKL